MGPQPLAALGENGSSMCDTRRLRRDERCVVAIRNGTIITATGGTIASGTVLVPTSASLSDLVKALNAVGATPIDLLAILQAMKAAGALKAELEII